MVSATARSSELAMAMRPPVTSGLVLAGLPALRHDAADGDVAAAAAFARRGWSIFCCCREMEICLAIEISTGFRVGLPSFSGRRASSMSWVDICVRLVGADDAADEGDRFRSLETEIAVETVICDEFNICHFGSGGM